VSLLSCIFSPEINISKVKRKDKYSVYLPRFPHPFVYEYSGDSHVFGLFKAVCHSDILAPLYDLDIFKDKYGVW
jgi:hypothetical protein